MSPVGEQTVNNFQQLSFDSPARAGMIGGMANPASQGIEVPSQHNWRTTDRDEIKLQSGRQAFLAKLQQLVPSSSEAKAEAPPSRPVLPADRPLGFAAAAQRRINGALVRCEERYPNEGHHSVLYVVVDRDASQWREQLRAVHEEYFAPGETDPLAPVRLEVVDRATDEALQRLIDAGLLARTSRATRPLWSAGALEAAPPPLSPDEQAKVVAHRQFAARKLKMARVVAEAGLEEDARAPLLEALLALGRASAVEQRLPEPALVNEVMLPPLSPCWKEALPLFRQFSADAAHPCKPVIDALAAFVPVMIRLVGTTSTSSPV